MSLWQRSNTAVLRHFCFKATKTRRFTGDELPNPNAIIGREVELIRLLNGEGGVPRIEIADRERAVLCRRVAVFDQELTQGLGALIHAPALGIGKEELLVARKAVDGGRFFAVKGGTIS